MVLFLGCAAYCIAEPSPPGPSRLDFFDKADNPLLFVTFSYDPVTGENTGRTVYMADSTFVRRTVTSRGADGKRESDVSYNFNDDTAIVTRYTYTNNVAAMTIRDLFGIDQIGGAVTYTDDNASTVEMQFPGTGEKAVSVVYDMDSSGGSRVYVVDRDGVVGYYGIFSYFDVPVKRRMTGGGKTLLVRIRNSGASGIGLHLNLQGPAEINAGILSLSGRKLLTVYSENLAAGSYVKKIGIGRGGGKQVADGMYLLTVSVNGSIIATARYLHQATYSGVGR
jgi:hypothetical protein